MYGALSEQDYLMERIMKDYGPLIKRAVSQASSGTLPEYDILSEVTFAIFLTMKKLGAEWTPPKSFIYAVIRNKVNDVLRQKYRERRGIEEIGKYMKEQTSRREEVVSRIQGLTRSEFQIFRLLGLGMTNKEMTESLHVSLDTIRSHLKKVRAKCGVTDRAKLTLLAHQTCFHDRSEPAQGSLPS
jgi:RNA polymerase sigma factor (sigma-70 family)